jgi:hypothetical protein
MAEEITEKISLLVDALSKLELSLCIKITAQAAGRHNRLRRHTEVLIGIKHYFCVYTNRRWFNLAIYYLTSYIHYIMNFPRKLPGFLTDGPYYASAF